MLKQRNFMKRILVAVVVGLMAIAAQAEATFQQIEGLIEQKQYQAAEQGLEGIIANHPNSAKAFYAMAQAQAGLGHLEKAQFALNKARGLDPELKFASSSNIESLQTAITPQVAKIEPITESHLLRNLALILLVTAGGYFVYSIYARKQEEEAAEQAARDAELAERIAKLDAERKREHMEMLARQDAERKAELAAEAALKAHKNYGHERFDPANPDKLKSVKQFKEEKLAEAMVAQARAEAAEARARAERAELDARLARSNAVSGPAQAGSQPQVVNNHYGSNNSGNDLVTGMVIGNMMSNSHHHDTVIVQQPSTVYVEREVPAPSKSSTWDDTTIREEKSSTWDTPAPSRSSSWDDSSSKSSSSWSSSSSDSSSSWSSSDSSSSSDSGSSWD
jgi:hypothetical protein